MSKSDLVSRRCAAAAFAFLAMLLTFPDEALATRPDAITPDGGRYYGALVDGKLHGRGRLEWSNGAIYEGEFSNGLAHGAGRLRFANGVTYEGELQEGLMSGRGRLEEPGREIYEGEFKDDYYWGQGELRYNDGTVYRGAFVRGEMLGKGRLEKPNGDVYDGEFANGQFTGAGVLARSDGSRYEGGFREWYFHGPGRFLDRAGTVWEGTFVDGRLEGMGKSKGPQGTYEGEFKSWRFQGRGVLRLPNGDIYEGAFANGVYEGPGTLTYAKPRPDGRTHETGNWTYGHLPRPDERKKLQANVETALYAQRALLDNALAALKPRRPGRINMYLLTVAGDGSQEVFRREVQFVQDHFARHFDTGGRSVGLVNSRTTIATAPMATVTSLREALKTIGSRMDRDQDILFLFLTSHGSKEHELSLGIGGMDLPGLPAAQLGQLLKASGIRWKVVVVSACYSGGFIEALQDDGTLVITAARRDRRSFGCADENDFTYFGRAFFKEALPKSASFQEAFARADVLVKEWELKDASEAADAGTRPAEGAEGRHSLPQIYSAGAIDAHLKRWWAQVAR